MADHEPARVSWWHTVPGMLTAAAAVITAVTGLLVTLNQVGVLGGGEARSESAATPQQSTAGNQALGARAPSATAAPGVVVSPPSELNLLSPDNGGQLLLAPNDAWTVANDGDIKQYQSLKVGEEAVFAFRGERPATFDTFRILIPGKGRNPKEIELLVADAAAGPYRALGTVQPQDVRVMKTGGWQAFSFPPTTASYLKVRLRSNHEDVVWIELYEVQLLGTLREPRP